MVTETVSAKLALHEHFIWTYFGLWIRNAQTRLLYSVICSLEGTETVISTLLLVSWWLACEVIYCVGCVCWCQCCWALWTSSWMMEQSCLERVMQNEIKSSSKLYVSSWFILSFEVLHYAIELWRCWVGSRKGIQPVKNWVVGCRHGYLSGARCRLAYGPADATVSCFCKIHIGFTFLYRLTWVVPDKGPLNGCVRVCVLYYIMLSLTVVIFLPWSAMVKYWTQCCWLQQNDARCSAQFVCREYSRWKASVYNWS